MSLVSVIVPCFNQARYVARAVGSALASSWDRLEVIVVDDGSTDDPAAALRAFMDDPRVQLIRQTNQGVAAARNLAIGRARGDLFHFLDADDWIAEDMLRALVEILDEDPALGLAYCDITHVDDQGVALDDYSVGRARDRLDGDLLPALLLGGYFPPVAAVVTRAALDAAGPFDPPLGGCCDWDLWARIAALGFPARYVDRKLASYRLHSSSMSQDGAHMRATMGAALRKLARAYPDRTADSIHALIERSESLFRIGQASASEHEKRGQALVWHQGQVEAHALALAKANDHLASRVEAHALTEQQVGTLSALVAEQQAVIDRLDERDGIHQQTIDRLTAEMSAQFATQAQSIDELEQRAGENRLTIERLESARQWLTSHSQALEDALGKADIAWREAHADLQLHQAHIQALERGRLARLLIGLRVIPRLKTTLP